MNLQLAEKIVIVTGGSSGIGYAIAKAFAAERARVIITARRPDALEQAARDLTAETGGEVIGIPSDTRDQARIDRMVAQVEERFSRIDVLVNCAATPAGLVRNRIEDLDASALLEDLNTKVVGYARCCKAVVPVMKRRRWGRIIHIGGLTGRSSNALSGMRNVALCHLTKSLSDQLGPDGITVNSVHPGVVRTPHLDELFAAEAAKRGGRPAEVEADFAAETPIRRILMPEEIAHAVTFLASPQAASITGESLAVDGGITRGVYL
ncbi:MAG TPA: SDR family oxidoreductase [Steroidobacteraceae bacterium]|nr:SDR family oxidoreductase [Steroidobacteraceae bacterium]